MDFFITSPPEHQRREKLKARELRTSPWWKNQLSRGVCHHCEQRFHPSELTMDHVIPVARGGFSKKGNVVPSCKPCNTEKGYKTALDRAFEELKNWKNPNDSFVIDHNRISQEVNTEGKTEVSSKESKV